MKPRVIVVNKRTAYTRFVVDVAKTHERLKAKAAKRAAARAA